LILMVLVARALLFDEPSDYTGDEERPVGFR
jgi:hypothetical protein